MSRKTSFTHLTLAGIASLGLALAACSGGSLSNDSNSGTGSNTSSDDLTPVTVGLLQIATSSGVQIAIDEGIFEKHGLDVTVQFGQGGAALLPAVSSGSMQFAVGNPLSVLVAASQGLDMRVIAGYSTSYEDINAPLETAPSSTVVAADSGITSWTDLEGKTVAVNTLNTLGALTIMKAVDDEGGDSSQVTFTEIAFPDQLAQLEQGNIDAAWVPEPFLTGALADGNNVRLGDSLRAIDGLYSMVTFTSGEYADANPDVVAAFRDAITEATALAMEDGGLFRDTIVEFTGMDAATVDAINLEYLSGSLDQSILQELVDTSLTYDFLDQAPDLDAVVMQ